VAVHATQGPTADDGLVGGNRVGAVLSPRAA
jgi:hypothetical protein